mgnify:CR=1 FL=1
MKPYKIYIPDQVKIKTSQESINYVGPIEGMIGTMLKGFGIMFALLYGCFWIINTLNGGLL